MKAIVKKSTPSSTCVLPLFFFADGRKKDTAWKGILCNDIMDRSKEKIQSLLEVPQGVVPLLFTAGYTLTYIDMWAVW